MHSLRVKKVTNVSNPILGWGGSSQGCFFAPFMCTWGTHSWHMEVLTVACLLRGTRGFGKEGTAVLPHVTLRSTTTTSAHLFLRFPAEYACYRQNISSRIWKYHLHIKSWVNSWGGNKRKKDQILSEWLNHIQTVLPLSVFSSSRRAKPPVSEHFWSSLNSAGLRIIINSRKGWMLQSPGLQSS